MLATNANIPRIQKMVSEVYATYGAPFEFEGETYSRFPTPGVLASAPVSGLRGCGLGYRAPFIKRVSSSVSEGRVDFAELASLPYEGAREALLDELLGKKILLGVGPKVADCVLLFSCGKDEAFPIDVWVARVIAKRYPRLLDPPIRSRLARDARAKVSPSDYARISKSVRSYFGSFGGYAQQYLFMAARDAGA